MGVMTDDRFDQWLRDAARDYHRPPATPREELWSRIAAASAARRQQIVVIRPLLRWVVDIDAVLALGVAIGRWSATGSPTSSGSAGTGERTSTFVYRLAAAQYLSRTEALLTGFRAEIHGGAPTAQFSVQARDLLCTTRLMLDSPAAPDVRLKNLLEDPELVLAPIAPLRSSGGPANVQSINQGLDQRSVLLRLRTANPAGPGPVRTQGAL